MTWLTWRQFRAQAIAAASMLAAVAIGLIITGIALRHSYHDAGLSACRAHHDCEQMATQFISDVRGGSVGPYDPIFTASIALLYLVPGLIGLFWGAPLIAREFETGTLRLAWNQSVTRGRWLALKLGLVGLAAMVTAGLLSLLVTWWSSPLDRALAYAGPNAVIGLTRLDPTVFGARDIVPIGYAALALALGVTIGVLIRRTVPAMAVTLALFVALQVAWPNLIRPHLIPPKTFRARLTTNIQDLEVSQPGGRMTVQGAWHQAGAWVISNQTVTPSGRVFTGPATAACLGNNSQACMSWLLGQHLSQIVSYEPASRFWAFQWYETGVFILLAVALAGLCAWTLNRRRLA
jgi:ABC-type transport system involved in multi-copper enzyme maturation permease subunit